MEKYTKAQMDVIEFENEDVITSSGSIGICSPVNGPCEVHSVICKGDRSGPSDWD